MSADSPLRILVLCKRHYTQHDLLEDRFGRLRELPLALAHQGHEVNGMCLSYRPLDEGLTVDSTVTGVQVQWRSLNAGLLLMPGLVRFFLRALAYARKFRPDIIWSASDSIYGIIGALVARAVGAKHVFDLYDNFEAFAAAKLPGVRGAYRSVIHRAHAITCVSEALRTKIIQDCSPIGPICVLPNGVNRAMFYPHPRDACRQRHSVPTDAKVIGITGAISRSRDIDTVLQAVSTLMRERSDIHLLLAGPRDRHLSLPTGPRVHDFGVCPYEEIPELISMIDVAIVGNLDSEFGRYCFPQKAHETIACGVSLVGSDVGAMHDLLADCPRARFRPRDASELLRALRAQLDQPCSLAISKAPDWDQLGNQLSDFLLAVAATDL